MTARPPELSRFIELVNDGQYWESHEVLEAAWRRTHSELLHGLILAASAWVHYERGNAAGVAAQARKAEAALAGSPERCLGLDIAALRQTLRQAVAWAASPGGGGLAPLRIEPAVPPPP